MAYLLFVSDLNVDSPTIKSITIVREYPDVFPTDMSRMPPDRDIYLVKYATLGVHQYYI